MILVLCHKTAGNLGVLFWEWGCWEGVGGYYEEYRIYWVKRENLRLELDDCQPCLDFYFILFDTFNMASAPTASLCDCQILRTPATGLMQRAGVSL